MRVAWDLQAITGPRPTGLGVSVRLLLDALVQHAPEIEVLGLRPNEFERPLIGVPDRLGWEQLRLPARLLREQAIRGVDMLYSPALGAPLASPVPVIAHVHDLIGLRNPEQFSSAAGWYWKHMLPTSWRACRALTVSNSTVAEDIVKRLSYPRSRIHVVPYYPDPDLALIAAELDPGYAEIDETPIAAPYFVTLASHEPRKNLDLAIRGLAALRSGGTEARLVCVGMHTDHTSRLRELAAELGVADAIELPEYVDRRGVVRLLLGAAALLFVSRYEGYGMPPQEAQSLGCAVVLSDIACHRAVYADPTRLEDLPGEVRLPPPFVGVDDAGGLAAEMQRLIADRAYRARLRRSGLAYSSTFSPVETAQALVKAFTSVARPVTAVS